MKLCVIYNEEAGDGMSADELHSALERAGHTIVQSVEKGHCNGMTLEMADAIAAAGGDGTVAIAAKAVIGQKIPIAILPLGTANNIAHSLGVAGSVAEIANGWSPSRIRKFDVGVVRGPWGERRFLEAAGAGLMSATFAEMAAQEERDETPERKRERLGNAMQTCGDVLARHETRPWKVFVDGAPLGGELLLFEALNTKRMGPRLELSLNVDASDGLLSVVVATEEHRAALADYLRNGNAKVRGRFGLPTVLARDIEIRGEGQIHVDDELLPAAADQAVSISLQRGGLLFLT